MQDFLNKERNLISYFLPQQKCISSYGYVYHYNDASVSTDSSNSSCTSQFAQKQCSMVMRVTLQHSSIRKAW